MWNDKNYNEIQTNKRQLVIKLTEKLFLIIFK